MRWLTADAWAESAAARIADALAGALAHGTRASLVLAGGSTPRPVYMRLADAGAIAWGQVEIFFGDERCVPPDHADSNYRMAEEALLDRLPTSPGRVCRIEGERRDRAAAAADYAVVLPAEPSVLLLGIGSDGHTASLFPGSPALHERKRRVVSVTVPATQPDRITITPPVLEEGREVFVLARGKAKAEAVARALEGPFDPEVCPAQLARHGTWLLDSQAASLLGREPA